MASQLPFRNPDVMRVRDHIYDEVSGIIADYGIDEPPLNLIAYAVTDQLLYRDFIHTESVVQYLDALEKNS